MTRIVLSLILLITFGFADLPPIKTYKTINEFQSDIYYGNGIMTTYKEAWKTLDDTLIPAILHEIYNGDKAEMNRMHHFDVAYNFSMKDATLPNGEKVGFVGGVLDLLESYEQLTDTSVGWEMFDYLAKIINGAVFGKKPWSYATKKAIYEGEKGSMLEFCIQDGQPAKMKSPKQAQSEAKKTVKNLMSPGRCSPGSSDRLRPRKGDVHLFFHFPIRFRT